jgi:hypothetical protein
MSLLFLRPPYRTLRLISFAAIVIASLNSSALASDITVASPLSGVPLTSPLWIRAHNVGCEGVPPAAFGYSIDDSTLYVPGESAYDIDVFGVALSAGTHIVHFKSWTANGACPVVDTPITVAGPYPSSSSMAPASGATLSSDATPSMVPLSPVFTSQYSGTFDPIPSPPHTTPIGVTGSIPSPGPSSTSTSPPAGYGIPPNAIAFADLDTRSGWNQIHDGGTPGTSRGSTVYPASTPLNDDAREFYMTYTDHAGERWSLVAGNTTAATHFVLDTYIYLPNPSQVMNLEMDINQVTSNGQTVILGTQCAGIDGAWEAAYTSGKYDHWWASGIKCDPRTWSANTWHHVQIAMHRGSDGIVVHDWVVLDGVLQSWGYSHESAHSLGWEPSLVTVQYQIEGNNTASSSITTYIHEMTIYSW